MKRLRYLRLLLYFLGSALLITLTVVLFSNGTRIIRQNAHILSRWSQNFTEPRPFLLIGLWALAVLTSGILALVSLVKFARLLIQVQRHSDKLQRKAA